LDKFNVANSVVELNLLLSEHRSFDQLRRETCRPSTESLQRTAVLGVGRRTGIGAVFVRAIVGEAGMEDSGGVVGLAKEFLARLGNTDSLLHQFLCRYMYFSRAVTVGRWWRRRLVLLVSYFQDYLTWYMVDWFFHKESGATRRLVAGGASLGTLILLKWM
jgi:hypothetical protein